MNFLGFGSSSGSVTSEAQLDSRSIEKAAREKAAEQAAAARRKKMVEDTKEAISKTFDQVNEATVGAYKEKLDARQALRRKDPDAPQEIGGLNKARKEELISRIEDDRFNSLMEAYHKNETVGKVEGDKIRYNGVLMSRYEYDKTKLKELKEVRKKNHKIAAEEAENLKKLNESGKISDDELVEAAGGKDASWYIADTATTIGDGISTGLDYLGAALDVMSDYMSQAYSFIKQGMCNNTPYKDCIGCPNRPKLNHVKPGALSGLLNALAGLKNGLTDALTGLLECPGLGNTLMSGDFKKAGGALLGGAVTSCITYAANVGAPGVMSGLAKVCGPNVGVKIASSIGKCVQNMDGSTTNINLVNGLLNSTGTNANSLFAVGGKVVGDFKGLAGNIKNGPMDARTRTNMERSAARAALFNRSSCISSRSTRTRCRITSNKLATLHGNTNSVETFRVSFAIDSITHGVSTPRCTRVRRHRSAADSLM